ncbi:MAG TPA: hypothetical protein VFU86_03245 [Terriglobales bacterium]|nr:hypothetical protein [Terriglobales bacterium]
MRQGLLITTVLLFSSYAISQSAPQQQQQNQTARQALIEMFFGPAPDHFEKHLPDITRRSLAKLNSPGGQNVLAEFSMIAMQMKAGGNNFQTFDTGPSLLIAQDPRGSGPDRIELTVERDDLIGDQDEIELMPHLSKNGQEQSLPVIPRFTFIMQEESKVWKLHEISVNVRIPLADPGFLKTIEDEQRSRNEQMTIWYVQQINTSEKTYSAARGQFACSLSALAAHNTKDPQQSVGYLWDPELAKGSKGGYVFAISGCDSSHYKVVAEPAVADSGQRAFCSDESGDLRASSDGKATSCLSSGDLVQRDQQNATGVVGLSGDSTSQPAETPTPRK